jgi:dienelactone hydrolase
VGSITRRVIDPDRPAHLSSAEPGRKLILKLWYPAEPAADAAPEVLWDQLHDPARTPLMIRCLLRVIQRRTASYPGAPGATAVPSMSPVIYNHGLVSFAAENTSLMEDLASRGHVVIAIEHQDQLAEFQARNRERSPAERRAARELTTRMRRAEAAERARLASELYAASGSTNRIVLERARDTLFVLADLPSILGAIPGARVAEGSSVHLVGYSLGGSVATQVAGRDRRAVSVVNIDGGLYASFDAAVSVPYLMIYSASNEGINDALLPKHATRACAANTNHLNYHDVAGLVRPLRWIRAVGSADPGEVLRWRNQEIANFLNRVHGGPGRVS